MSQRCVSILQEVRASDGIHVMKPPEHYGLLSTHDKPRNLAKSVTVE